MRWNLFYDERPFQRGVLFFAVLSLVPSIVVALFLVGIAGRHADSTEFRITASASEIQRLYNIEIRRLHAVADEIHSDSTFNRWILGGAERYSSDTFSYLDSRRNNPDMTIDVVSVDGVVLAWAGPNVRSNYLNELGDKPPGPLSLLLRSGARTYLTAGAYSRDGRYFVLVSIPFHTAHNISEKFLAPKGIVREVESHFGVRVAILADTTSLLIRNERVKMAPLLDEHGNRTAWIGIRSESSTFVTEPGSFEITLVHLTLLSGFILLLAAYGSQFTRENSLRFMLCILAFHSLVLILAGLQNLVAMTELLAGGSLILIFVTGKSVAHFSPGTAYGARLATRFGKFGVLLALVAIYFFLSIILSFLFEKCLNIFAVVRENADNQSIGFMESLGEYSVTSIALFTVLLISLTLIIQRSLLHIHLTNSRSQHQRLTVVIIHAISLITALIVATVIVRLPIEVCITVVLSFSYVALLELKNIALTTLRLATSSVALLIVSMSTVILLVQGGVGMQSARFLSPMDSRREIDTLVVESLSRIRRELSRHPAYLSVEMPETRNIPFELWSQTDLASGGYGSAVFLYSVTGREIGHFITGIPLHNMNVTVDSLLSTITAQSTLQEKDYFDFRLEDGIGIFTVIRDSSRRPSGFAAVMAVSSPAGLLQVDAPYAYSLGQKVPFRRVLRIFGGAAIALVVLIAVSLVLEYFNRPKRFREMTFGFRTRLTIIVSVLAMIPPLAIWFYSAQLAERQRENRIQFALEQGIRRTTNGLQKYSSSGETFALTDQVCEGIADETGFDFIVYSEGRAISSSKPELLKSGFVDGRLPGVLFAELESGASERVYNTQMIGSTEYRFAFLPFKIGGSRRVIVGIPSLFQFAEIDEDLRERGVVLLVVSLISLMLVWGAGFVLSHMLATPLRKLRGAVQSLAGGEDGVRIREFRADEFGELMKSFNDMADELEKRKQELIRAERELAWREMARQVAHEIKNPLTPLKLNIQHLAQAYRDKSEEFGALMDRVSRLIVEQVEAISRIAEEFSAFARMPKRAYESVEINKIMQEAVDLFSALKNYRFELQASEFETEIIADRDELRRAFINIIRNAVQSMGNGGTISLSTGVQGGICTVIIADTGIGMESEVLQKLGSPNFTTRPGGSGIGIAITKRIIEDLGGTIRFESVPGSGTTVTISLPLMSNPARARS